MSNRVNLRYATENFITYVIHNTEEGLKIASFCFHDSFIPCTSWVGVVEP